MNLFGLMGHLCVYYLFFCTQMGHLSLIWQHISWTYKFSKFQIRANQVLSDSLSNLSVLGWVTYLSSWIKPWLMDKNVNIFHPLYLSRDNSAGRENSVCHIRVCLFILWQLRGGRWIQNMTKLIFIFSSNIFLLKSLVW